MKINVKIKNLPKEFDFKSNINPLGLTYHAIEKDDVYIVTSGSCLYHFNKQRFYNYFLRKEFVVC